MRHLAVALTLAVLALPAIAAGPYGPPPAGMPPELHALRHQELDAQLTRTASGVRELGDAMEQRQVPSEYREMNRALGQELDCIRSLEQRMEALEAEREFRSDKLRLREMDRFQDRMRVLAADLEEIGRTLRALALSDGARADAAPPEEQAHLMDQHRATRQQVQDLGAHLSGLNAWMVEKGVRTEFVETGHDMEQLRAQQSLIHRDVDQLLAAGAPDRDRARDLDRLQDRTQSQLRELTEAHESLTRLVGGP